MQRFLIERQIDGASELTEAQLAAIAETSNQAVASLGVPYTWVTTYVAGDKLYCLHETDDAETVLEHARRGGFPADLVSVVANEFGPQTAERVQSADQGRCQSGWWLRPPPLRPPEPASSSIGRAGLQSSRAAPRA